MSKYDMENKKLKETMNGEKGKETPFFIGEAAEDTIEKKALAKWKNLTISSDFVFCKVMQDKELLKELLERIRYNGSMMDAQMLDKGILYSKLSDSYVIMICPFDLFGLGRHIYTFKYMCVEAPSLELGDGTTKIVLNASGTLDDIDQRLRVFLDYVAGKSVDDEYIRRLDEAVRKAKMNKHWRARDVRWTSVSRRPEWKRRQSI